MAGSPSRLWESCFTTKILWVQERSPCLRWANILPWTAKGWRLGPHSFLTGWFKFGDPNSSRDFSVMAETSALVSSLKDTAESLTKIVAVQYFECWESSTVSRKKLSRVEESWVWMSLSSIMFSGLVRHTALKWPILQHLWHLASLARQRVWGASTATHLVHLICTCSFSLTWYMVCERLHQLKNPLYHL